MYWGMMINLGYNMWNGENTGTLRLDKAMWDDYMPYLQSKGINLLLVDIGEGLKYATHPELAVNGSWSRDMFLAEVEKIRGLGIEVVPKLNFSTTHDFWLQDYERMVSSRVYYQVCKDLIDEVCQILKPKYFHLGMDEENFQDQLAEKDQFICVRQNDLWWHDLYFYQNCVEKNNARAWVWTDYICDHPEEFLKKMSKEIIQSGWYYLADFELVSTNRLTPNQYVRDWYKKRLDAFEALSSHGYDQIPTGSNWCAADNMKMLVQWCCAHMDESCIMGYLQTPWALPVEANRNKHWQAADLLADARQWHESR